MATACGQRSREFGVLVSFSQPLWTEEVNALFPGFNMTEIEDDDGACKSLVELIWRYNCIMGDLETGGAILGSDSLYKYMSSKFENELMRMQEAVDIVMVSEEVLRRKDSGRAASMIDEDFQCYRSSLMMQMRNNPLGTREWLQHFEMYMSCAAARRGLGYIEFVLY